MNDCMPLDGAERDRFGIAESMIASGLRTIRDERLCREEYADFVNYCRIRWSLDIADSQAFAAICSLPWSIEHQLAITAASSPASECLQGYVAEVAAKFESCQSRVVLLMLALAICDETAKGDGDQSKAALQSIALTFIDGLFRELMRFALPDGPSPDYSAMIRARRALERIAMQLDRLRPPEATS
jgi:hypothetical protein